MQKNIIKISFLFWLLPFLIGAFLFLHSALAQKSNDAIAFRVIANPKHHSPSRWYTENIRIKGSPSESLVDGYRAVRDGRTVYVGASNFDSGQLYTNIYIISYNQEAETATVDIFGQILAHWRFNTNLETPGNCYATTTMACINDRECPAGDYCTSLKGEVVRNTRRLSDLADIESLLAEYKKKNGKFPTLSAGSYRSQKSLSVWPSWQETLAKNLGATLPEDPINRLGTCPPNFNPSTCWDEEASSFSGTLPDDLATPVSLPSGSEVYVYRVTPDGLKYILSTTGVDPTTVISGVDLTDATESYSPVIEVPPDSKITEGGITYINIIAYTNRPFSYYVKAIDPDSNLDSLLLWRIDNFVPVAPASWIAAGWSGQPSLNNSSQPNIKELRALLAGNPGSYYFNISVKDDPAEATWDDTKRFKVTIINRPPIITVIPPDSKVVVGKSTLNINPIKIIAADPEGDYPMTNNHISLILPSGLIWQSPTDDKTLDISGIPNFCSPSGNDVYNYSISFSDSFGNQNAVNFTISIVNNKPTAQVSACATAVRVNNSYPSCQLQAVDPDMHTITSYTVSGLPNGMSASPAGLISGTPSPVSVAGVYNISVVATDQYGASSLPRTYTLTVKTYCGDNVRQATNMESIAEDCDNMDHVANSPGASSPFEQYSCDSYCKATGGWCGDNIIQATFEQCDGVNNTIVSPGLSNSNNQYGCSSNCQKTDGGYCGDGIIQDGTNGTINAGEVCETGTTRSCIGTASGMPSYCSSLLFSGTQTCASDCRGWNSCNIFPPSLISNNYGQCDDSDIFLADYACCELLNCQMDGCCGGRNSADATLPPDYTLQATLPYSTGNCKLGQSTLNGRDWVMSINHTTGGYQCWH